MKRSTMLSTTSFIRSRRGFTTSTVLGFGFVALTAGLMIPVNSKSQDAPKQKDRVSYTRDVEPIFKAHCTMCHGPDSTSGGLRLDTPTQLQKGGVSGKMLVSGDPAKSVLLERIKGHGGKQRMPMGFAPLSAKQEKTISDWIQQGAIFDGASAPKHWAYVSPVRPKVEVSQGDRWSQTEIDRLVLAHLKERGLTPSPRAPKETLLRRVALDLTGLPPTLEERAQFLSDSSPKAYESMVDRYLASSRFGEHLASKWLDLARYADSNGYEKDLNRTIWPYRDWVISAFNRDLPFDQFTVEQLAGDLLPSPTQDQLIATGFHRNTMKNEEGGVDQGEARWLTLVDRVGTTGSVWLGSTVACAQCHDHKYDPIKQDDFYKMLAYFEPAKEPTLKLKNSDITTLILEEERTKPTQTAVRLKGAYLSPGKTVSADTPSVLPKLKEKGRQDRLQLAKWLVSRQNPLTARVHVNRLWAQIFGVGLVKTEDDFGTQGEVPAYQDVLDWLAVEFMDNGWSHKKLLKTIVMSSVYQQSSAVTEKLYSIDAQNRLLARGPRFRLSAEMLRDNMLAVSGLLSTKMGGPSVYPDQPDGVWNIPYSGESWQLSPGEDRYRRGVYTFWKRSSPFPAFMTFDATSREFCTTQRIRTNTPLQALNLLNDEVGKRAAIQLARTSKVGNPIITDQIRTMMLRAVNRPPRATELERMIALYRRQWARYQQDQSSAKKLVESENAELAALTTVAQVILNLDETITKE